MISYAQYPRWVLKFKQSEHRLEAEHGIKKRTQQTLIYLYFTIPNFYQQVFVWLYNYNYVPEWDARWFTFFDQMKLVDSYSSQRHTQMYTPLFAYRNFSWKSQTFTILLLDSQHWLAFTKIRLLFGVCFSITFAMTKNAHIFPISMSSPTNKTSSSIGMARSANGQKSH